MELTKAAFNLPSVACQSSSPLRNDVSHAIKFSRNTDAQRANDLCGGWRWLIYICILREDDGWVLVLVLVMR